MNDSEHLTWDDLTPALNLSYSVWDSKEKRAWGEQAWSILHKAHLTKYETEIQRAEVVIRFLALTGIFADFYEIAFEDGYEPQYGELAESLNLSPIRVGQLIGSGADCDEGQDDTELYSDALRHLAGEARSEICRALVAGYGHASQLFISLWRTNLPEYLEDDDAAELDNEIVNSDLTPNKMEAYNWITEGCYPYSC